MTIEATVVVWKAEVRPKEKLVLLWAADAGEQGMAADAQGIGRCAAFVNASPRRIEKAIARLLKSGHLEATPHDHNSSGPEPRVRVNMGNPP